MHSNKIFPHIAWNFVVVQFGKDDCKFDGSTGSFFFPHLRLLTSQQSGQKENQHLY